MLSKKETSTDHFTKHSNNTYLHIQVGYNGAIQHCTIENSINVYRAIKKFSTY